VRLTVCVCLCVCVWSRQVREQLKNSAKKLILNLSREAQQQSSEHKRLQFFNRVFAEQKSKNDELIGKIDDLILEMEEPTDQVCFNVSCLVCLTCLTRVIIFWGVVSCLMQMFQCDRHTMKETDNKDKLKRKRSLKTAESDDDWTPPRNYDEDDEDDEDIQCSRKHRKRDTKKRKLTHT